LYSFDKTEEIVFTISSVVFVGEKYNP